MDKTISLGELAYNAYCASTNWKSVYTGADLPAYDQQRPEVITAWEAAGQAVAVTLLGSASNNSKGELEEVGRNGEVGEIGQSDRLLGCCGGCPKGETGAEGIDGIATDSDKEAGDETYAIKA